MAASGELGVPTRMSGVITGRDEQGNLVANMTQPEFVPGVVLPADAEHTTRVHQYDGARTRITSHLAPELGTDHRPGTPVVAQVAATETQASTRYIERRPYEITVAKMMAGVAVRWGTVNK